MGRRIRALGSTLNKSQRSLGFPHRESICKVSDNKKEIFHLITFPPRFNGGYLQVTGGWAGDAFATMTGGVAERVESKDITAPALFARMKNALNSGAVIACSCPVGV